MFALQHKVAQICNVEHLQQWRKQYEFIREIGMGSWHLNVFRHYYSSEPGGKHVKLAWCSFKND